MDAIILAAGKGSRMAPLTTSTPKPMLLINQKPILEHIIESLPDQVDRVIIVVDYLKDQIISHFSTYKDRNIIFVNQEVKGTMGALISARPSIFSDKFLVLNGDDILSKIELEQFAKGDQSIGLHKGKLPNAISFLFTLDEDNKIREMRRPIDDEAQEDQLIATGTYLFNHTIWDLEPISFGDGTEYGIPQTIRDILPQFSGFTFTIWHQINTLEQYDIAKNNINYL